MVEVCINLGGMSSDIYHLGFKSEVIMKLLTVPYILRDVSFVQDIKIMSVSSALNL